MMREIGSIGIIKFLYSCLMKISEKNHKSLFPTSVPNIGLKEWNVQAHESICSLCKKVIFYE